MCQATLQFVIDFWYAEADLERLFGFFLKSYMTEVRNPGIIIMGTSPK